MTPIERLEDRIWRLQNSFGWSPHQDGLTMREIAELEREIARILNSNK